MLKKMSSARRKDPPAIVDQLINRAVNQAVQLNMPYGEKALENMRFLVLEDMKTKTSAYYLDQMKAIGARIDKVMTDDHQILNDDYWDIIKPDQPYWQKETSNLETPSSPGNISLSHHVLTKDRVEKLVGDASWMTIQQKILFKTLVLGYFRKNERLWPVHLNMDYAFLRNQSALETADSLPQRALILFQSLLSGAGPFMLKVFQQINTSNDQTLDGGIKVSDLAKNVFGSVPPLTNAESDLVKGNISFFLPSSQKYIKNMKAQTLGSASIAETHETHDAKNRKAIIKIIKPIYAYFFLCEVDFLLRDAWKGLREYSHVRDRSEAEANKYLKQCRQLLMFFIKEFTSEFDYHQEAYQTRRGHEIYNNPESHLRAINVIDVHSSESPFSALVLDYVEGTTLDSLLKKGLPPTETDQNPWQPIYERVDKLIVVWFKNTLWGDGFFHADLHPGNLMISPDLQTLSPIDFGSCGQLTEPEQCALLRAMIISGRLIQLTPEEKERYTAPDASSSAKLRNALFIRARDTLLPRGRKLSAEEQLIVKLQRNYRVAEKFVQAIWNVCHVNEAHRAKAKELAQRIVEKNAFTRWGFYFSELFLNIVALSDDIGSCTTSAILLFGRACAYVGTLIMKLQINCAEYQQQHGPQGKLVCPVWAVDNVIRANIGSILSARGSCLGLVDIFFNK